MDFNKASLRLEVQQRSFPVASGSPCHTVDWLPDYFGYGWVAYASHSSLVISIIASPTSKNEEELGLCQVIDSPHDAPAHILCVRWAPSPTGLLGASCEHLIWIYTPQFSNPDGEYNSPDFPWGWVLANKLEHTFKVWSFGWTESGDGLLSVGSEVIMWKQYESGWHCLWTSPVTHPQVFAAATWSANGLAATAEGNFGHEGRSSQVDECKRSATKGKATVWWWEDSLGLLESELVHPQEIVFLQWRPSKGPLSLKEAFRPVLLTACKDGAVRLWLEIDSGRARLDKALGKDVSAKHLKPAYFVSAVIEAEQCLHGILGTDVFLSWPLECRTVKSDSASACSSTAITKRQNPGSCEWLVGLGPEGSIFLWSVFCLDDIYPPRCPRVFLWKQAGGVLSVPVPAPGSVNRQVLVKIVARRFSSRCADPPSTLDLFYTSQPTLFQWSRIWPPISALSGDPSKSSELPEVGAHGIMPTKTKKDVWGVVTESFNLNGHSNDIVSIAIHPITFTGLVASLDSQGHIFLWHSSFFVNRSSSLFSSVWRSSGESLALLESNTLTWLPAVFSGGQTVLLGARAGFIDCYLISKRQDTSYCGQPLAVKLLCSLNLAVHSFEQFLAIWALPLDVQNRNFVVIGLGEASGKLVLCYLQIIEEETNSHDMDQGRSDQVRNDITFLVKNISSKNFGAFDSFASVAFPSEIFLPSLHTPSDSIMYEPLVSSHVYDIATGSRDGVLKLWKRGAQYSTDNSEVAIKDDVWQCVGFLKVSSGPVNMIAIACSGLKMATWCPTSVDTYGEGILIWSIERVSERATFHLSDRVSLVGCPISMQWLDLGNGGSILGLLMQSELLVYTESHAFDKMIESFPANQNQGKQTSDQSSWHLLASAALFSRTSCFTWGPKGSLLVPFKEHLLVYDLRFFPDTTTRVQNQGDVKFLLGSQRDQAWSLVRAGTILSCPLPVHHPVAILHHLYTGNHQRARACLRELQQNLSDFSSNIQGRLPCGLLQIYSPAQLLEIFLNEAKTEKNESKTQDAFLSWSAGNARDFEDYATSFSSVHLAGENINKACTHHENETPRVLNVEKLEFLLTKSLDVLGLTEEQRMQLLNVTDVIVKMDSESKSLEYASLDHPGQRFWLAVQLSHSRQSRKGGKFVRVEDLCLDTRAMAWALQSECKDTILDLCLGSEISWPAMRALGAGFWLIDTSQLRSRMEKLARTQYLVDKNPKHCALLYLALQRKNVLMGLFKLSKDEKDRVLYEFLGRDFLVEKNRAAALKNAYVLLGRHQHDLAAAFFLLGGDLNSATSACAKNLGDLQLALVICHLFEGTNGPNEQRLIKEYALTKAQNEGDCWLASLFQWLMGERTKAIEEMTGNLCSVFESVGYEDGESNCKVPVPDSTRQAFVDPEVGMFCLHLVSKPVMQSGLSNAAMTVLCKWLFLKTSASLERLGLPLEAMEYLSSAKDSFWTNLLPNNERISGAIVNHLTAFKNRLALRFQAQLVMAHPCWLFGTCAGSYGSDQTHICISSTTDAYIKLLQALDLLENGFTVDSRYIAAEISRFAHCHNMLYLQCVFARGVSDGVHETRELRSLPCLKFLNHSVKQLGQELFKVIDPMSLSHYQPYSWNESFDQRKQGAVLESATEISLLASDVWLLLGQSGDNIERNVDVAFLALVLYSVAAWKKYDWSAIGFIARFIVQHGSALSLSAFDMEAAFGLLLGVIRPSMTAKMCLNLGQLTEIEIWHVVGLAFWNAFVVWGKQHLRNNIATDQELNTNSASQRYALDKGLLEVLESIASVFQRKLVFFLNTSLNAAHLCSWLLDNYKSTEVSPSKCQENMSSVPVACDVKAENMKPNSCPPSHIPFSSKDYHMDEVWRQLLVPSSIRSAVELGGAKLATIAGKTCIPECLEGSKTNIVEPIMKNNAVESALHDSEGYPARDKKEKSIGYVMANGNGEVTSNSTSYTATGSARYKVGEEVLHSSGDLLEAICVNSCCPNQVVVASSRKGLLYFDINTGKSFSYSESSLWSQAEWPQNGWANTESTPIPTFVSPGVGLRSKEGPSLGLGGATVGEGILTNVPKEPSFKVAGVGIPGYGGMGALGLGWDTWEDDEGIIDPLATMENVNTQAMDSHPLRPLFLVGSRNTHVYLWEFGKSSATATYGVLPAANIPPPYALASVSSVKFDHSGHRFATSAIDGTVCTWQLEVGGRSNVRPTDSCLCFDRHASDVAFVGGSGGIIAATGASQNNFNLVFWDTLAPASTSQAFVYCHEGGARCVEMFDQDVGGGSISSLIVTCGKGGDVAVHDFRYIATGKTQRAKNFRREHGSLLVDDQSSKKQQDGALNVDGSVWYIAKAHSGSITCVSAVPGTSLFFTGSKDGDVKLWDVNKCELVNHWHRAHDKHMFLQHNARGFGAVVQESRGFGGIFQAAVTDVKPVSLGFLSCGGDGIVRLFRKYKPGEI